MNQREREVSVQPSRDQHIVLLLSCMRRDRSCATGLLSLAPHIFSPFPFSPPLIFLSVALPLFSKTTHIWFWVKARLVSTGMEGFYFSMAPLPLQFHSAVKSMQFVYELVFLSLCWYYSILISMTGEPHNHPQLMASESRSAGQLVVIKAFLWCPPKCQFKVTSRNCVRPVELTVVAAPKTLFASIKEILSESFDVV